MRQALIIGARPSFSEGKEFPNVPLGDGKWRLVVENHKDSEITYHTEMNGEHIEHKHGEVKIGVVGPCKINAKITKRGTESYVNVFAELIK